ncbi:retrovirus-related pol polyprotein from transposon TNT 1-94 [Tanacetum coccineum]
MIRPRAFVGGSWSDNGEEDDEKAKDETCLIARASNEICLRVDLEPNEWIKDSECSKHMTGNRNLFSSYNAYNGVITLWMRVMNEEAIKVIEKRNLENDIEDETLAIDEIVNIKESRNHPLENVIGNLNQITLRSQAQDQSNFFCFISTIEPKNVNEALTDKSWLIAMQEESNQFIANDVWELVAQGYNQQEGIIYDETYAPVAILESIRILLAYACALDIKLLQMDVKSVFLNSFINEEVMSISHGELDDYYDLHDRVMYSFLPRIFHKTRAKDSKGLWHEKRSSLHFFFLRLWSTILLSSQR